MDNKHLSFTGAGPFYVASILIIAFISLLLDFLGLIPEYVISPLIIPKIVLGIILIVFAAVLWIKGALKSDILKYVEDNKLLTCGIYSCCRNPIYSAFMFLVWGICLIPSNIVLLFNLPLSYLLMGAFLIPTEEKWLTSLYGDEYKDYCKKVNRAIPWFPKK